MAPENDPTRLKLHPSLQRTFPLENWIAKYREHDVAIGKSDQIGLLCVVGLYLVLSLLASFIIFPEQSWWAGSLLVIVCLVGAHALSSAVNAIAMAIWWKVHGRKFRILTLIKWMEDNKMPAIQKLPGPGESSANNVEMHYGLLYMTHLSSGRFGGQDVTRAAIEYLRDYSHVQGPFARGRETEAMIEATKIYFSSFPFK